MNWLFIKPKVARKPKQRTIIESFALERGL
jgi:hypothetical protein